MPISSCQKEAGSFRPETLCQSLDGKKMPLVQLVLECDKYDLIVKYLSDGGNPDEKDTEGTPALALAAMIGSNDVVAALLQAGAKVDEPDADGNTALHLVSAVGNLDGIQLLIGAGADVNARDADGKTPLFKAATMGETSACRQLCAAGSDVRVLDDKGRSVLHWAAMRTNVTELIELLLGMGVDPNLIDTDGTTAIGLAEKFNHASVVQALHGTVAKKIQH